MGKSKTGGTTEIKLGTHFFPLIFISDLPKLATIGTKIILYADDTSIKVTSSNVENFGTQIEKIFGDINNWFKLNQLVLNYNKTNHLQFNTKNSKDYDLKLKYHGHYTNCSTNTKFLNLIIEDSLSWKSHIDQMMYKLNTGCFVIRTIQAMMAQETLRMVYFASVHSVINYGIILFGNNHIVRKFSKSKDVDQNYYIFKS